MAETTPVRFGTDPSSRHLEATLPTLEQLTAEGPYMNAGTAPIAYLTSEGMRYLWAGETLHPDGRKQ